jgi:hypothetical protein
MKPSRPGSNRIARPPIVCLRELETWKAKARALDEAVAWLKGQIDSEKLRVVDRILRNWMRADGTPRRQSTGERSREL